MDVLILGAGEVGADVARLLSMERHNVTVIDKDGDQLRRLNERLDVLTVQGNGTSATVLEDAGVSKADLMLAVTSSDEVNIIASMIAHKLGVRYTVARVRSEELTRKGSILPSSDLGIDLMINPEESGAEEVVRLIRRSCATDVVPLADGELQVLGVRLGRGNKVVGTSVREIAEAYPAIPFLVVGIQRGVRTILPRDVDVFRANDQVFFLSATANVPHVIEIMGKESDRLDRVMILGGSRIGQRVASALSGELKSGVKLVESDREEAERLAHALPNVLVIHGDPTDIDLLATEGLGEMDALLALTENEEANLVASLVGKHIGVRKTVALLSKSVYIPLSQSIGLDAAVNRKLSVANEILRFLRSKSVQNVANIPGLELEIMEVEAQPGSRITRKPLRSQQLPMGLLVGAAIGPEGIEIGTGATQVQPGDTVIVFAKPTAVASVDKYFSRRFSLVS